MPAHAATTNATIDGLSNLLPSLADISNGLPPPLPPEFGLASLVVEVALLVVVVVDILACSELVVVDTLVSLPPPAECSDVDAAAEVLAVILRLCVLDTSIVELDSRLEVLPEVDCAIGVAVEEAFVAKTTAGLDVGIVTESAAVALPPTGVPVAVFASSVGHNACSIPPSFTIPNNVVELILTSEQASLTLSATDFNAAAQPAEHPGDSKSATIHVGI